MSHRLPKTTKLPHPIGIIIGRPPGTQLGNNCTIMQNVTIGILYLGDHKGPKIGDGVTIGCGAAILGDITVGNNAIIGANAVVLSDVPDGALAIGVPARIVSYEATKLASNSIANDNIDRED